MSVMIGFYSEIQAHIGGVIIYSTPYDKNIEVTQILECDDSNRGEEYFTKKYVKRFPDGKFLGIVTNFVRRVHRGLF